MSRVTTTTIHLRASELRPGMIVSVDNVQLVVNRQEYLPNGQQRVVFEGGAAWDYRPFILDDNARWMVYVTSTTEHKRAGCLVGVLRTWADRPARKQRIYADEDRRVETGGGRTR